MSGETRADPVASTNSPAWARGAVWYQVFPERFRNGNTANDPRGDGVFLAPWNSDWYQVQPGELEALQQRRGVDPAQYRPHKAGPLYDVIYDRRFGGDLQGVVEKLDDLIDLGVTAIYLNPIFQARSLHKYDASDFRHIDSALAGSGPSIAIDTPYAPPENEADDPATWTWTQADRYFLEVFLPECRKRGLRVIIDGVFNHTGTDFWAFQDIVRRGRESPYASWYQCEFDAGGRLVSWIGWPGRVNGGLPEFRQVRGRAGGREWDKTVEKGDLNAGVKKHIFDITRRWMDPDGDGDPADGVDGWRLDVAGEIGDEFWKDWRALVKSINPDALIVAEIWNKVDGLGATSPFDTQMFYPFAYAVLDWLRNSDEHGRPVSATQLRARLDAAFADDPHQTQLLHQMLFASHDTDRYVNMLWNPGRGYDQGCAEQNLDHVERHGQPHLAPYKPGRPPEEIYRLSVLGVAIQATYIGSPMIYYGDEWGMWGSDDPNCRKPLQWEDQFASFGEPAREDERPQAWLREEYKRWLRLRTDPVVGPILRLGSLKHLDSGSDDVFAFEREHEGRIVIVLINRGDAPYDGPLAPRSEHGTHTLAPRSAAWHLR